MNVDAGEQIFRGEAVTIKGGKAYAARCCDYCGRTDFPKDGRCQGCGAPRKMPKPPPVPPVPMTR